MSEINILGKTVKISSTGGGAAALNTDKLTVAACSKVFGDLHDTLIQKGIAETDISADNPTGLVDAVKALPTNTAGSMRRDWPLALMPSMSTGASSSACFWDVVDGYFRIQNAVDAIYIHGLSGNFWNTDGTSSEGGNLKLTINKSALQNVLTAAGSSVTLGDIKLKAVPESLNAVYYSSSGHAGVITPNIENGTFTATCVALTAAEGSLNTNLAKSNYRVFATNGQKMLLSTDVSDGQPILVNLSTGAADAQNWSFLYSTEYKCAYYSYNCHYYNGVWLLVRTNKICKAYINWDDMDESSAENTYYAGYPFFGFAGGKIYFYSYDNNVHTLEVYDVAAKTKTVKTLTQNYAAAFLFLRTTQSMWNAERFLHIETLQNGYTQILTPMGFIWLDGNLNFVKPISGASQIGVYARNGQSRLGESSNANYGVCFKCGGNYYVIYPQSTTNLRNGLVGVYYGKVLFNFYLRNETPVFYPYYGAVSKALLDSNTLDASTVSISVDVSGGAQEAGGQGDA